MATDIVNRLREPLSMSMFRNSGDLFAEAAKQRQEAADHIEALERKVGELEAEVATYQGLLDAAIDDYNDAIKPKPDDKPFTFADPVRQAEWERHKAESKRREVE